MRNKSQQPPNQLKKNSEQQRVEAVVEKVWKAEDDEKDVAEEEEAAAVHLIMLTFMVKGKTRLEQQLSQWGTHTMRGSHRESRVEAAVAQL